MPHPPSACWENAAGIATRVQFQDKQRERNCFVLSGPQEPQDVTAGRNDRYTHKAMSGRQYQSDTWRLCREIKTDSASLGVSKQTERLIDYWPNGMFCKKTGSCPAPPHSIFAKSRQRCPSARSGPSSTRHWIGGDVHVACCSTGTTTGIYYICR